MEPKDHPTARASLIAALDWARNVDVERHTPPERSDR